LDESSGKGKTKKGTIKYGFSLVKGSADHSMEDYHVSKFEQTEGKELGLFAIFDGHMGDRLPSYFTEKFIS